MVAVFGAATRSKGQVFHMKKVGEGDHPIYVAKDYGTFCIAGIGKLCNSCSDFRYVDVAYGSGHILFGCELHSSDWEPRHIIVGIFEASDTAGATLAVIVKRLLSDFHLTDKVISYVKDEGSNLRTLASALTSVVSCKPLALLQPYPGVCFGHIMSKACQCSTDNTKVYIGM